MFCSWLETVKPSPIMQVDLSPWCGFSAQLSILRDDLNHPIVSGNKLRKLKYPLQQAIKQGIKGITSFGGPHSNHAHALAYACQQLDLECQLIIRGEEASPEHSPTLTDCYKWGAKIRPVSRADYRLRHQPDFQEKQALPDHLVLPEGGSASAALHGVAEVLSGPAKNYKFIACAMGSAGTAAGLASALAAKQKLIVVPAVKDNSLPNRMAQLLPSHQPINTCWLTGYEWGGFARFPELLQQFTADFYHHTMVLLDPVYTAKLTYALIQEIAAKRLPANGEVLMYHSGGLQGWRAMAKRLIPEMQACLATLR